MTRAIKGDGPIRPGEFDDRNVSFQACRSLWSSKLLAMMHDATQQFKRGQNLRPSLARGWFGTYDFCETCWCAGIEPDVVMREAERRFALCDAGKYDEAQIGLVQKGREAPKAKDKGNGF